MAIFHPPPVPPVYTSATGAQPYGENDNLIQAEIPPVPPPFDQRRLDLTNGIELSWRPPPPMPTWNWPRYLVQGTPPPAPEVSDPPLLRDVITGIRGPYYPVLPKLMSPALLTTAAAAADNPPFGWLETIIDPWLGNPPLPILPRYVPQAAAAEQVPFTRRDTIAIAVWQPGDPFPIVRRLSNPSLIAEVLSQPFPITDLILALDGPTGWPVVPKLMSPALLTTAGDNPPFSHMGRWVLVNSIIRAWEPGPPLPTLNEKLTPPSVDNPPFGHSGRDTAFQPTNWTDNWTWTYTGLPEGTQPYAPRQSTPPSVDNPPRSLWRLYDSIVKSWEPGPPLPTLNVKRTPPSVDNPPFSSPDRAPANQPTNWTDGWSWTYTGLPEGTQPYAPRQSTPPSVDNPPQSNWRLFDSIIRVAWEPGPPLPTLNVKYTPSEIPAGVNDPPFSHPGRWSLTNSLIRTTWEPPPPQPTLGTKLTPPSVDNPPFTDAGRTPAYEPTNWSDGWSWTYTGLTGGEQPYAPRQGTPPSVDNPPSAKWFLFDHLVRSWEPGPPLPTPARRLTPPSVDNPPTRRPERPETYVFWEPGPPLPTLGVTPKLTPPSVDNPPPSFWRLYDNLVRSWDPFVPIPTLSTKATPPSVDNPPTVANAFARFGYQFEAFAPYPAAQQPRGGVSALIPPPVVNDPPFSHRGRLENQLVVWWQWQPPDPLPTPSVTIKLTTSGPFIPPVTVTGFFTVSGETVQDLWGPVSGVSWEWGGGTQKRTTKPPP